MQSDVSLMLKLYREKNNYSQAHIANYLGIGASAYSHYETGNREPGVETLKSLAQLYGLEDQILGVKKNNSAETNPTYRLIKEYTIQDLYNSINHLPYEYKKISKYTKKTFTLLPTQFTALSNYFCNYRENKENVFYDFASANKGNDGKLYEALVYAWLESLCIPFESQKKIEPADCLNSNGYLADGIIDETAIFDVKMFGISHPNIIRLQAKLNQISKKENNDYIIMVSGYFDIDNEKLQEYLRKSSELYSLLFKSKKKDFYYEYRIDDNGLLISAHKKEAGKIIISESSFNPYKWAKENQYYFFNDSSQFSINKPYIIIIPYDEKTAPSFAGGFTDSILIAFRSLCRRIFMGMSDDEYIKKYDKKTLPLISTRSASQCISAIIFKDVSLDIYGNNTWMFVNPNANNKLPGYISNQFRMQPNCYYDDYLYDNY